MIITLGFASNIVNFFLHFFSQISFAEVLLIFSDLECLQKGIMCKSRFQCFETIESLRHVDSSNIDSISRGTFTSNLSLGKYFHRSGYMSNRNLIRWFLDFNLLVADKLTRFDLKNELTFDSVLYTFLCWAFDLRIKLSLVNDLVDFSTASVTGKYSHLYARLDIADSRDNTSERHKATNYVSFDFPHFLYMLFFICSWNNNDLV